MRPSDDDIPLELAPDPGGDALAADAEDARARWQGGDRAAVWQPLDRPAPTYRPPRRERPWLPTLGIALAALLGGGARLATADWGLPYALHVDEKGFVVHEALAAEYRGLRGGDYRPHNTSYGPLVFEVVIATKWALFGGPNQARALAERYPDEWAYITGALQAYTSPTSVALPDLLFALRALAALFGALTIWWLGLAAQQLETPRAGVIAASLAAASVGLFQASHFYTPESLLMPALAWFLFACAKLATEPPRAGNVLRAGLAVACIAGSKGPGLLCLVALPAALASHAQGLGARPSAFRRLTATLRASFSLPMGLSVVVAALAFAAMNPWLVSGDPGEYFRGIAPNRSGSALLALQFSEREFGFYDWRFVYNDGLPFWTQLRTLLPYALGGPACVAAYLSIARGLRRGSALDRIVLWSALPPLLLVGGFAVATQRYVLPSVPGLVLGAASLLAHPPFPTRPGDPATAGGATSRARRAKWFGLCAAFVAACVVAFTCARGVAYASMFRELDPRVLAGRYLAEHAQPGDRVLLEPEGSYSAVLNDDYDLVGRVPEGEHRDLVRPRYLEAAVTGMPRLQVRRLFVGRPNDAALPGHLTRSLARARFVVVGDWYHRRARHPGAAARAPIQRAFYEDLFAGRSGFQVAASFPRAPRFPDVDWGYVWDEHDEEALAVCFDHMPITVFERAPADAAAVTPNGD
ncbi:MAG: glycosyltransferase family 39 protein [Polyangiales bacterium]